MLGGGSWAGLGWLGQAVLAGAGPGRVGPGRAGPGRAGTVWTSIGEPFSEARITQLSTHLGPESGPIYRLRLGSIRAWNGSLLSKKMSPSGREKGG